MPLDMQARCIVRLFDDDFNTWHPTSTILEDELRRIFERHMTVGGNYSVSMAIRIRAERYL